MSESILIMHKNEAYQNTPSSSIPRRVVRPKQRSDNSTKHNAPRSVRYSGNKTSSRKTVSKKVVDAPSLKKSNGQETTKASADHTPHGPGSLKHQQRRHVSLDQISAAAGTTTTTTAAAATVAAATGTVLTGIEVLELDDLSGRKTIGRATTKRHRATLSEKFLESLNRQDSVCPIPQKNLSHKLSSRQKIIETVSQKAKDFNSLKNAATLVRVEDDDAARLDGSLLELQVLRRRAIQEFMTSRAKRDTERMQTECSTTTDEFENNFEYLKSKVEKDINCPKTNLFDMDDVDEEYISRSVPIYAAPVIQPTVVSAVSMADHCTGDAGTALHHSANEHRLMTPQDDGSSDLSDLVLSPARLPKPDRAGHEDQSDRLTYQLSASFRAKGDDDADDSGYHAGIESGNEEENIFSLTDDIPAQLHKQADTLHGRIPMFIEYLIEFLMPATALGLLTVLYGVVCYRGLLTNPED
ncbi:uncharacterized protein V1513DRAFT_436274 [Lipomyces chichibuensis]|uniref:uncharacterized protein n=1 Tax=Lipomyces chichibuensis TaxID=1546026 RepID=UPI0033433CDA